MAAAAPLQGDDGALHTDPAMRHLLDRLITLSSAQKRTAVVLRRMSRSSRLALHWTRWQQLNAWHRRPGIAILYAQSDLDDWCVRWAEHPDVASGADGMPNHLQQSLLTFMAEWESYCGIHRLLHSGIKIPAGHATNLYIGALSRLDTTGVAAVHLKRLREQAHSAKRWRRQFRKRWGLEYGEGHMNHGLSSQAMCERTLVFMRWMSAVLREVEGEHPPIIVNMDETMMSNIRSGKLGIVPSAISVAHGVFRSTKRKVNMPRTSMLASICNDADLQKVLPQLRLPKAPKGKVTARAALNAYAQAGQPQSVLHGGCGWNNGVTMVWYLRELRKRLRSKAPLRPIVLVMDDCSIHVSDKVLRECVRLGIAVVIIPSRMTWKLQPLDTHVFAPLKANIRAGLFAALGNSPRASLSHAAEIRVHGLSIREVLVNRDWSSVMRRSGLTGDRAEWRQGLCDLVGDAVLTPSYPSEGELKDLLSVPASRVSGMRASLVTSAQRAANPQVAVPAAAADGDSQAAAPAGPVIVPMPIIRLKSSARLPAVLGNRREQATLLRLREPTASPVMTRSRSRLALASESAASGSAGPAVPH